MWENICPIAMGQIFFKTGLTSVYHYAIMGLTQVNQNKLQKGVENGKADYFIRW